MSTSLPPPPTKRSALYRSLDLWRGIASLGVVLYHFAEVAVRHRPELASDPIYKLCEWGFVGVPLFFVISGYCIIGAAVSNLERGQKTWDYVWARLRRIYPTYWAAYFLMLFIAALTPSGFAPEKANVLLDVTLLTGPFQHVPFLPVAWSLSYEILFYAIIGVALIVAKRRGGVPLLLQASHVLTLLCLIWQASPLRQNLVPLDLYPQFGLGVLVYDILVRGAKRETIAYFAATGVLTGVLALVRTGLIGFLPQPVSPSFPLAFCFALLLMALFRKDEAISRLSFVRPLSFVGTFSYSLYLTHFFIVRIYATLALRFVPSPVSPVVGYALLIGAACVCIGFAYLFFLLCERPLLKKAVKPTPRPATAPIEAEIPPKVAPLT